MDGTEYSHQSSSWKESKWIRFLTACTIAVLGGFFFQLIHMPLPWLLGSMVFVLIGSKIFRGITFFWPVQIRNTGMIIIGYTLGLSFTASTLAQIGQQLPTMVLFTALLLVCAGGIAFIISLLSGIPFPTILMGSIPGGLSQMVSLAEEMKGIDLTIVTFLQVSRLIMIMFCVPLLIFSPLFHVTINHSAAIAATGSSGGYAALFPHIWLFAVVCVLLALIGQKIRFPTAFLLGPMIGTMLLNLSGYEGHSLPILVLDLSQIMMGSYIGLLLKPENLKHKLKIILLALFNGVALIGCSILLSLLLTRLHDITVVTSFLSLSPGGMDQMAFIAKDVNGDLSVITCYQLFRTLFIFFAVPPLLRVIFQSVMREKRMAQ
ncbi:AbrB family transcriptional regulator [Paenibacillus radicis (ex Xue et al. 2023)]|uniref:AbrB family transcriptional regulator n=1 Tax=Paenibacillus radicis (ex Xue et al. 2023) TaxID=2972489 RepID=A0ABT1YJG4_9BACL|nr:AbrB family transcriptional regulator [Paenibacillus radicis (ex Xue et al. 2023)]MCR8632115.1 AbrB family transcriptional regulator [Paenibacillus radicis (ex Xue et al. 2023)]